MELLGFPDLDYAALEKMWALSGYAPWPESVPIHSALITPQVGPEGGSMPSLVVVGGGEQGGKSRSGAEHAFARWPNDRLIWLVGQRYEDCETEYQYLREAALKTPFHKKSSSGAHPDAWELEYVNGHRVKVLSSEDVSKIAREAPDGIIMCEAGRQSYDAFRALWRRASQLSGWFLVSGTFENDPERWYADLWTQCQGDNPYRGKSFSLPTWANRLRFPEGRNDPKFRELVRSIMETNPMEGAEEVAERFEGRPRQPKGMVFSEFRTNLHVRDFAEYQPGIPVLLFVDPGWFPSSYAVAFCQKVGRQLRQFDEIYVQHKTNREVIAMVKQHECFPDVSKVVLDRASKQHNNAQDSAFDAWVEELNDRGIVVTDAGYVKELDGRARLHDKLLLDPVNGNVPNYIVAPRCKMTIWEFQRGYKLRQRNDGTYASDEPIDRHNHIIKALTYGVMVEFGTVEVRRALPEPQIESFGYERAFQARRRAYAGRR